ncbi:MAG: cation transporter [Spirochaetaceae bacterium]|nr:cation transporter [Spirochaetaceae bacterium]
MAKIFIPDYKNFNDSAVRIKYGVICGAVGIALNIVLFALKLLAGIISKSVAIVADAFNNLSDAGASVISIIGFKLSDKKPDADHPFGHGRGEYVSGLLVSFLILLLGVELLTNGIKAIISPIKLETTAVTALILIISVAVKFYMYIYNHSLGKKTGSLTLEATAKDSLSDMVSTVVVLISSIAALYFPHIPIDGITGIVVAVFVLKSGVESIIDTINPLLGVPPEKEFIRAIENFVMSDEGIYGIHDLVVHDYGPGRKMVSLHAEVDGYSDVFKAHELIDDLEIRLSNEFNCQVTIHLDPIDTKNPEIAMLKTLISQIAGEIHKDLTIHDLRTVSGEKRTNVIFDAVRPYGLPLTDRELKDAFKKKLSEYDKKYCAVINIDDVFV